MFQKIKKVYTNISVVKKATIWFLICSILQKGIAFLTTPIFTRLMSTEQYGEYSIYLSWFQILTLITSFRLDYAVFNKGMSKYDNDKDTYTSTMQIITTIATILFFMIYIWLREQINEFTELSTKISVLMFINVLFMNSISFWTIRQRYDYKYKSVVLITLLLTIVTTILGVITVNYSSQKGIARIISLAFTQIVIGVVIYVYNLKKANKVYNSGYAKFAILFNIPLLPHFLSLYILEQSDKIMIQKIIGIEQVALYSVAYSIGNAINIIVTSINQTIIPWLYRKLKEKRYIEIKRNLLAIFIGVQIIISLFIFTIPELLRIIAAKEYNDAIYVIAPIAASTFFSLIYGIFATIEFYFEKNKFSMIISGAAALINIILNFVFIKTYGYVAAAYTTMICYMILSIGHLIYTNNILKENDGYCIMKISTIIILFVSMIAVIILSQLLNSMIYIRYLIILIILIVFISKKEIVIEKFKTLKK